MADIANELQTIATAVYGSEMRSAIHDAIEKVNEDTSTITTTTQSGFTTNTEYAWSSSLVKGGDIVVANIEISVVNGRSGYTPSGTPDEGITLLDLPAGFIPKMSLNVALTPNGDNVDIDIPIISFTAGSSTVKIKNAFSEILGDVVNFYVNCIYFV